jgi:predicted RNase H-like nuclease (RuvC/YqgF family)
MTDLEKMDRDELVALVKTLTEQNAILKDRNQRNERQIESLNRQLNQMKRTVNDYVPEIEYDDRF